MKVLGDLLLDDAALLKLGIPTDPTEVVKGMIWFDSGRNALRVCISETGNPSVDYVTLSTEGGQTSSAGVIGGQAADYLDGLIPYQPNDPVGKAVDDFNVILKALAPPKTRDLLDASCTTSQGASGKLSSVLGGGLSEGKGIYGASQDFTGKLNDNTTAHEYSYPADTFNDFDGTISLLVDDVEKVSVTCDTGTNSSISGTPTAAGSNISLSSVSYAKFASGATFDSFRMRTGTWTLKAADLGGPGKHTITIKKDTTVIGTYKVQIDDVGGANTTFPTENITNLVTVPRSDKISGVAYHQSGTIDYNVTISNAHVKSWKTGTPISFPTTTNCASIGAEQIPDAEDDIVLTKTTAIDSGRKLGATNFVVNTSVSTTLASNKNSAGATKNYVLLIDPTADGSNGTTENFDGEKFRAKDDGSAEGLTSGWGTSGAHTSSDYDSSVDITSTGDLLVYNGKLQYPKINFQYADGPAGNPDYSGCTGARTYLRHFYSTGFGANFKLAFSGISSSDIVDTGSFSSSGNKIKVEVMLPNQTAWLDASRTVGGLGYAGTYGSSIPTNWGVTFGSKQAVSSGYAILVKITAGSAWTGAIESLTVSAA